MNLPKLRLSVNRICQLSCKFCGGIKGKMENFQPDNLSPIKTQEMTKIIESYIEAGGRYVQFTGGEPLLNKDIYTLVEKTAKLGGIPEINTNGVILNEQTARRLQKCGLKVLKISVPSVDRKKYKETTDVDCLDKVIAGIRSSLPYLYVRVNHVLTKSSMTDLEKLLNLVNKLKVPELLLLELLYYKHLPNVGSPKKYFESEYVNIKSELKDFLEKYQGNKIEEFPIFGIYGTKFYKVKSKRNGTDIVFKQADPTLRIGRCLKCKEFCQEGIYELRISDGGYLNVCNVVNELGFYAVKELKENSLDNAFSFYKKLFDETFYSDFSEFKKRNQIKI